MSNNNDSDDEVTLHIPSKYEDDMMKYFKKLSISDNITNTIMTIDTPNTSEISKVIKHKIVSGEWYFLLKFKDEYVPQWVTDDYCFCEELISAYLNKENINTVYYYCRVSSKNQIGPDHYSLDTQEHELIQNITNNNKRVKIIRSIGSAYKNIPKDLRNIGDSAHSGDEIVVYRVDRFGRNIVSFLSWMEEINNKNVKIISYKDKIDYSKNRLEFIQKLLDATKESKLLSERIKLSVKFRRDRGDVAVGKLKFGKKYKRVTVGNITKQDVVDDVNALNIIKKIKNMKYSNRCIAEKLNDKNLFKNNKRWTPNMIKYIKDKC
jgi:DNA invertase Pin-like site-specific DNA recombinase